MKQYWSSLSVIAISLLTMTACRKENSTNNPTPPGIEEFVDYKHPDTATAQPGVYMVTYKEEFVKPFCKIYNGSRTIRGAKTAAAEMYARTVQTQVDQRLMNADGSPIIAPQNMEHRFSNLVVGFSAQMDKATVKKMVEDPMVKTVERQELVFTEEGDTKTSRQAYFEVQKVDALRTSMGYADASAYLNRIFIIDSGLDTDHPDLNVDEALGKCFYPGITTVEDGSGHGTKVAGVMAAKNNGFGTRGIAAGAHLVPIRISNNSGASTCAIFVAALDFVWQQSVEDDVVNISQSFPVSTTGVAAMEDAVHNFSGWDMPFAVAAGNQHSYASGRSPARMSLSSHKYAADMGFLKTISAYGPGNKFSKSFSNYGSAVDYAAPGEFIYTTAKGDTYAEGATGTSFATPIVAGILFIRGGTIKQKGNVIGDVDGSPDKIAWLN